MPTVAFFIDFSKAYDMVPHTALWGTLAKKGITGNLLQVIQRLYSNQHSCVRLSDGSLSDPIKMTRGVRQGDPMSPLLFNVFIDSVLENVEGVAVPGLVQRVRGLLYADDLVVLAPSCMLGLKPTACKSTRKNRL